MSWEKLIKLNLNATNNTFIFYFLFSSKSQIIIKLISKNHIEYFVENDLNFNTNELI